MFLRHTLKFLCFMALCATVSAQEKPPQIVPEGDLAYLAGLQKQAQQLNLAKRPYWHKLIHYERHPITRRLRSLADAPDFFNAGPSGIAQPEAELQATLAAMFDTRPNRQGEQAARCRFPARWLWLQEQLGIDPAKLPEVSCPRYSEWRKNVSASQVTLVFPSAYVNSPASMYGHTFLRLDPSDPQEQTHQAAQPLLSYTISYAADASASEGLLFAFKGLVGAYPGTMSNGPYYVRIREYMDLENRDIWEYKLNFTPAEINRLQAHTWELAFTRFDYYFFDENCAYLLINLLDIARPGLDLSAQFAWYTMPVDTVRAVALEPGLVQGRHYRPSNQTELSYRASTLSGPDVARALELSRGQTLEPQDQPVRILELAERLTTLRAARGELDDTALAKLRLPLLGARAKLPEQPELAVPTPRVSPEACHRTGRWELTAGSQAGHSYWRASTRPSYHDVLDPEAGFQPGAQIQFFEVAVGQAAGQKPRLESFTPVDILSLSPVTPWQSGMSWKVRVGASRAWGLDHRSAPLTFDFNAGPGWAWSVGKPDFHGAAPAMLYAFMDNQLWHDRSRANHSWRLGSGLHLGFLWSIGQSSRLHLQATHRAFTDGGGFENGASVAYRFQINSKQNLVLRCEQKRRTGSSPAPRCETGWQRYW